jgi:MraZ protein
MFTGTYFHSIDDKNRLRLPSKLRDGITGGYVLSEGDGRFLCIYTSEYAESLSKKYSELALETMPAKERREAEARIRDLFSTIDSVEEDKQGRFVVPALRVEFAGIKKNVVIIGANTRIELWAEEEYALYLEKRKAERES